MLYMKISCAQHVSMDHCTLQCKCVCYCAQSIICHHCMYKYRHKYIV